MQLSSISLALTRAGLLRFDPKSLFASGAPGVWYDPSDLTTLFQDSAGTTPVTAVEQPVGRMLDKSGYGNHAFQATSASRPVLSARYNLLTKTEEFNSVTWLKTAASVTADSTTAPNGTLTADTLIESTGGGEHFASQQIVKTATNTTYTKTAYFKNAVGTRNFALGITDGLTGGYGAIFTTAGSVVISSFAIGSTTGWTFVDSSVGPVGDGWYRASLTVTSNTSTRLDGVCYLVSGTTTIYSGNGTSGIYIWGASLVPSNQATLPYQRVNTSTDYNTTGFLPYLKFDGVDDSLTTNNINFTSTDKMSVFAGVRKLSEAAPNEAVIAETYPGSLLPSFSMFNNSLNGLGYTGILIGTGALSEVEATTYAAPNTAVVSQLYDFAGATATDEIKVRVNGILPTQNVRLAGPAGTGNFGNYPLYIGRRGGTTLPFNGQMYSMIIVGKAVTAGELSSIETYVNQKTGAY